VMVNWEEDEARTVFLGSLFSVVAWQTRRRNEEEEERLGRGAAD